VVLELGNVLAAISAQKKTPYNIAAHLNEWKNGDGLDFLYIESNLPNVHKENTLLPIVLHRLAQYDHTK
jgi:hypothetical protein